MRILNSLNSHFLIALLVIATLLFIAGVLPKGEGIKAAEPSLFSRRDNELRSFQYSGMVMPIEGAVYSAAPARAKVSIDTVWCGSYYYFPSNYKPRTKKESEIYTHRSTGSGSHPGVDIGVPVGTPVRSIARGVIILANWHEGWGNLIVIEHHIPSEGIIYSCYAHLAGYIRKGGIVQKGEYISYSGQTGTIYPHLHFQIDRNPFPYYPSGSGAYPYSSPLHPVNRLSSQKLVKKNTLDPLLYVVKHKKSNR